MAPTRANGVPGGSSQEQGPADLSPAPIPLPRTRPTPRRRTLRQALRYRRPVRPSTVWPCAQDNLRESGGLLAGWLLTAIVKIVTTYTQPGQRVLLLEPAPYLAPPLSRSANPNRNHARPSPYTGLREAGWTVARLGRGIQTHAAVAQLDSVEEHLSAAPPESASGPGLDTDDPTTDQLTKPSERRRHEPDPTASDVGPDHYDLVITAADPRALDWFPPADWAGLLTPTGTLAVITHGDQIGGRFTDPASSLTRDAHHAGLRYLERVALLRVPIRDSALVDSMQASIHSPATTTRHVQVHDDLLVFTRRPAQAEVAASGETSDG